MKTWFMRLLSVVLISILLITSLCLAEELSAIEDKVETTVTTGESVEEPVVEDAAEPTRDDSDTVSANATQIGTDGGMPITEDAGDDVDFEISAEAVEETIAEVADAELSSLDDLIDDEGNYIIEEEYSEIESVEAANESNALLAASTNIMANSNAQTIYTYLKNTMGLNNAACAAVLANIKAESDFDPHNSYTEQGGYTSYGICQWNQERLTSLQNYCRNNGYDYTTLNGQLHYFEQEIKSNYYVHVYNNLKNAANSSQGAYDSAYYFCTKFEIPANMETVGAQRGGVARQIYSELDTTAPSISNVKVTDISSSGYTVTCTVSDNVGVTKVLFPSWYDGQRGEDATWHQGTISGNTATCRINVSDHNNKTGCQYTTHIYAYDAANNSTCAGTGAYVPAPDTSKPTISNAKVTNVSSSGYTVTCTVSDNIGVTTVKFPTWTAPNDQDDIIWHVGTISGNTASFTVKVSDHNNEIGCRYYTHIYAYDAAGNYSSAGVSCDVPTLDKTKPVISNVKVTNLTSKGYTITCDVSDNVGVTKVQFPTWCDGQKQGEAIWHDGTVSGNTAKCNIKVSDHGNRTGLNYHTIIYAWDAANNFSTAEAYSNYVPKTDKSDTTPAITVSKKPASVKTKVKKNKVTVSWKKIKTNKKGKALLKKIQCIEAQCATDANFTSIVSTKKFGKKKTKVTFKLQKKTQYYFRVRYIGTDGGVSNWSAVKKAKTKK